MAHEDRGRARCLYEHKHEETAYCALIVPRSSASPPIAGRWTTCRSWAKEYVLLYCLLGFNPALDITSTTSTSHGAPPCWYSRAKANNLTSRLDPSDSAAAVVLLLLLVLGALANVDKGGSRSHWWVPVTTSQYMAVLYGSRWEVLRTSTSWNQQALGPAAKLEVPHLSPWLALRPWHPRRGRSRGDMPPIKADAVVLRPSTA